MDGTVPMRYQPRNGAGIVDTATGRFHAREYTAVETLDTVAWLNERNAGYPIGRVGAVQ